MNVLAIPLASGLRESNAHHLKTLPQLQILLMVQSDTDYARCNENEWVYEKEMEVQN